MTLPFDAPSYNWSNKIPGLNYITEKKIGNASGHNIKGWTYQVYKVQDKLNGNTYAVKVGELKQITPESIRSRLNSLSPVFSPAVIPNFCYYIDSLYVCIVTPYCTRGNLEDYIYNLHKSKTKPSVEEVKGFVLNILDSLDFLHLYPKKYQVHGNIKPSNIFFTTNDLLNQTIAIGDIFHCQVFTDTFPSSSCSSIELLEANDCTTNSDIWSVGCVLYYICTGQYPFPKKATVESIKEGKHGELLKTGKYECFNGLFENMISLDKKKRYPIKKIRDILNSITNGSVPPPSSPKKKADAPKPASQPAPSPPPPPSPPVKRKAENMSRDDDDDDRPIFRTVRNLPRSAFSFTNPPPPVVPIPTPAPAASQQLVNTFNTYTAEVNKNLDVITVNSLLKFIFDNYSSVRPLFDNYSGQLSYVVLKAIEDVGCLRFEQGESLPADAMLYRILTSLTYTNLAPTVRSISIIGGYNFSLDLSSFQTCMGLFNMRVLRLNYVGLDDNSHKLFQNLHMLHNLTIVDISHNKITDAGITSFMAALTNATALTELNVGYNSIKQTGGNIIGSSLPRYPQIQSIGISSCNIGLNGFKNIINGLTCDGSKQSPLLSLYAENNSIGDQGFAYLGERMGMFNNLQQLLLSNNRKTATNGDSNVLMKKLMYCLHMKAFTFQQNKINDLEVLDLCYSLNHLRDLCYLELGGNDLNNNHILNLSTNLKNLTKLTYLGLGDNKFDRTGLQNLCSRTFQYLVDLESLVLDHADIKGTGIDDICQCINNGYLKKLKEVSLAGCKIKSEALKKLFVTFKKLLQLESLDISDNQFDDKQIQIIQNSIGNYPNLRLLNVRDAHSTVDNNLIKAFKAAVSKSNPNLKLTV